jgi:hypothetical protein
MEKMHHVQLNMKKDIYDIILELADDEDRTPTMMCNRLIKEALIARGKIGGSKQ